MSQVPDADAASTIRVRLEALQGVAEADTSSFPASVSLRLLPGGGPDLARAAVTELLKTDGASPDVLITSDSDAEQGREEPGSARARFDTLDVTFPAPGLLAARAELEWRGERFTADQSGEYSPAGELRVCAGAVLQALERITGGAVAFNLIGVKELQVFDHSMVVVLVHSPQLPERRMIGSAIISKDRRHAAGAAALNATNRAVGRWLEG